MSGEDDRLNGSDLRNEELDRAWAVGATRIPSFLSSRYRGQSGSIPARTLVWVLAVAGLVFFPLALLGVGIGVRAMVRGDRRAWVATVAAVAGSVAGYFLLTAFTNATGP